ncbi:MAG: outer membrane lipoprotein carrier protein LolA [Nitrospirota bacterium]
MISSLRATAFLHSMIIFCLSFSAYAVSQNDLVSVVENHYQSVQDITASVSQKNVLKAIGKTQTFEGTLFIKKPGKLRIEYTNGQIILIDGKTALFYSKKSRQAVKRKFSDFASMNIPVAFLLGVAHLRDDFTIQSDPKQPLILGLLPKKSGAAMRKLTLQTDETGRITRMVILDRSGNTSEIIFTNVQENSGIADGQFLFQIPSGTEIIEQ